jgi:hypothetical protein
VRSSWSSCWNLRTRFPIQKSAPQHPARSDLRLLKAPVSSPNSMAFESFTVVGTQMLWPKRKTFVQSAISEACAEQRVVQEGSSPSGAQMRGAISKSEGNSSLAEESKRYADV